MHNETSAFEGLVCQTVNSLNDSSQQCLFVRTRDDCFDEEGWIDYPLFFYCTIGAASKVLPLLVSALLLLVYFLALGTTAEDFMCPSLAAISKLLHLSENVAGVTFLALGNGAPDIFASIAGIRQSRPELVVSELLGGGIFVTTIVVGFILLTGDFKVKERPFSRDIFFYASACFVTWSICYRGSIFLWESVLFLVIYIVYIGVVIVGRIVHSRKLVRARTLSAVTITSSSTTELQNCDEVLQRRGSIYSVSKMIKTKERERRASSSCGSTAHLPIHEDESLEVKKGDGLREFVYQVMPFRWAELKREPVWSVLLTLVKSPIQIVLTLTVPNIDGDDTAKCWSQVLNCLHVITGPLLVAIAAGAAGVQYAGFPCLAIVAIIGTLLALAVFFTSTPYSPPIYYPAFSLLAFVVSCCWVYSIASEVVALLETLGFLLNVSEAILGLTVLAWGNSLGDLVANLSIARHGFQRMALSACFGGPLLNLLLGIGIPYSIVLPETSSFSLKIQYTTMFNLLISVLMITLGFTMAMFIYTGFRSVKYHGIVLIVIYVVYLVVALVVELSVI